MNSRAQAICTVFASHSLGKVKALFRSIQKAHPNDKFSFFALNLDSEAGDSSATIEQCQMFYLKDLEKTFVNLRKVGFQYNLRQFEMVVKPLFLNLLYSEASMQDLIYLDPENYVLGSLKPLFRELDRGPILLTPHILTPLPDDGAFPSSKDILVSGCFNLGFLALRNSKTTQDFLSWWANHLLRQTGLPAVDGLFVDQRWLDLVPAIFPEAVVLRSKIYNVAFWNLHERLLQYESGVYLIEGEPLAFFQFQGFDPEFPQSLSNRQSRFRDFPADSAILRLCQEYAFHLRVHRYYVHAQLPYGFDFWDNGIRIPALAREMLLGAAEWARFGDPQNTKQDSSYFSWLMYGAESFAPRLLHEIWKRRPDLQKDFPDPNGLDRQRFLNWAVDYGVQEQHLDPRLTQVFVEQL